jgi:hypothetical protein
MYKAMLEVGPNHPSSVIRAAGKAIRGCVCDEFTKEEEGGGGSPVRRLRKVMLISKDGEYAGQDMRTFRTPTICR